MTPSTSMEGVTIEELKSANISGVPPRIGLAEPSPLFPQDVGSGEGSSAVPKAAQGAQSPVTREQIAKVREEVKKEMAEEDTARVKKALPKPVVVPPSQGGGGAAPAPAWFEAGPPMQSATSSVGGAQLADVGPRVPKALPKPRAQLPVKAPPQVMQSATSSASGAELAGAASKPKHDVLEMSRAARASLDPSFSSAVSSGGGVGGGSATARAPPP